MRCIGGQTAKLREQLRREGRAALPFANPTGSTAAPQHTSTSAG